MGDVEVFLFVCFVYLLAGLFLRSSPFVPAVWLVRQHVYSQPEETEIVRDGKADAFGACGDERIGNVGPCRCQVSKSCLETAEGLDFR